MDLYSVLIATIQIFIITDPIGNLPIFVLLTKKQSQDRRHETFLLAAMVGFALLLLFTFAGVGILSLFRITLNDFKIAGGILLLVLSILLLVRGSWFEPSEDTHEVGVVPLGCPLLVGPGAITTAMVLIGIYGTPAVTLAVLINFVLSFGILYFGEPLLRLIGKTGSDIISRIMVILIAALAVSYIQSGIKEIILNLK